jgi:hypothetical protein
MPVRGLPASGRIKPAGMKWVTAADPLQATPESVQNTILPDRINHVL